MKTFWLTVLVVTLMVPLLPPGSSPVGDVLLSSAAAADEPHSIRFALSPNPAVVNCLARFPGDPSRPPTAVVTVVRGKRNDLLTIHVTNIKPGLAFDLFTVQRSRLLANGSLDPAFTNFGLAWYQSELEVDPHDGSGTSQIRTILLDEVFGFDPDTGLAPTNTFHVGFWFDDPADATACGFTGTTPFNGTHNAGPLAMISLPDATTGLGPLCTKASCP
jgi:hypothetical protein